jgi:hypothetical protein
MTGCADVPWLWTRRWRRISFSERTGGRHCGATGPACPAPTELRVIGEERSPERAPLLSYPSTAASVPARRSTLSAVGAHDFNYHHFALLLTTIDERVRTCKPRTRGTTSALEKTVRSFPREARGCSSRWFTRLSTGGLHDWSFQRGEPPQAMEYSCLLTITKTPGRAPNSVGTCGSRRDIYSAWRSAEIFRLSASESASAIRATPCSAISTRRVHA